MKVRDEPWLKQRMQKNGQESHNDVGHQELALENH